MADFSGTDITVDLSKKTATIVWRAANYSGPAITVVNVPWDTPEDQTESQIKALVIENARKLLREA